MIQTGLLTTAVLIAGLSGPALASTQGWNHAPQLPQAVQNDQREAASGDVIQPPAANIDPDMTVTPPDQHGKIRIIPPAAGADTQKGIAPK
jgi:hypothetical protein